jgi:predicted SnoaL-like aldol condensation-catalyzing enzyme
VSSDRKTRDIVIAFYNGIAQRDYETLRKLGRPDYIQHNPDFETGLHGLIQTLQARNTPAASQPLEFVRVLVDGDFVMTLRRAPPISERASEPGAEIAIVDIFRVQSGLVAEHWDYKEHFPRSSGTPKNRNGRF